MYFVYILQCKDKTLYTGISTDVTRRFTEHKNKNGGKYTGSHPADKIVYVQRCKTRGVALKREAEIKRLTRKNKLNLIKTYAQP